MKQTVYAIAMVCAVGSAACADTVYMGSGAGLTTHPGVSFPNSMPGTSGGSLHLITPPQLNYVTVVIPLCEHIGSGTGGTGTGSGTGTSGSGSGTDSCNIVGLTVHATFSGHTNGLDVNMGVTDGTRFVGSNHSDYFRFYPAVGEYDGHALVNMNYGVNVLFAGGPVGGTFTFSQEYTFNANSTELTSTSDSDSVNMSLDRLDLSKDLALVIGLFDTYEAGNLDSITIVTHTVPAPGPIALLGMGGVLAMRRQRTYN